MQTSKYTVRGGASEAPGAGKEALAKAAEGRRQNESGHVPPEPQDWSKPVLLGTRTREDPTGMSRLSVTIAAESFLITYRRHCQVHSGINIM